MRLYYWTDLSFAIKETYNDVWMQPFLSDITTTPDCTVVVDNCFSTNSVQESSFIYRDDTLLVFQKGKIEIRLFLDPSGDPYAELQDFGGNKTLLIKRASALQPCFSLLNHLALEKTMNEHGRLLLHASFIETEQGAVLFSAPPGTGKSTQAELWRKYRNATIVNGDRAGIWRGEDGWMAGGVPWCGTSGISLNRVMPLRAVVILRQGSENVLEKPRFSTCLKSLMEQTTINPWNKEMYLRTQNELIDLCQNVPVYSLHCRPDEGAVEVLSLELDII